MSAILTHHDLKSNALAFSKRWDGPHGEEADAKSFLDEFFRIFGRERRQIDARFEHAVPREGRGDGYIDLFWPGRFLVEMKSTGKDLRKAADQAFAYIAALEDSTEVPRWVLTCDFARFELYDLGDDQENTQRLFKNAKGRSAQKPVKSFDLSELPRHLASFGFIRNEDTHHSDSQTVVNLKAVKLLGELHDSIKADDFKGHALERFLVRVLFSLFAEDTDIFPWCSFTNFVRRSKRDGSDLGARLAQLFQTLDTEKRQASLPEEFKAFPYINGGLFRERLDCPALNDKQRAALLKCCDYDWSLISPAIFGSLFQGVMLPKERREKGAHYTSEENIRKVIDPLFLDSYKAELAELAARPVTKARENALKAFHDKLADTRLLDPACGCGNFLVIAYCELRLLELETLKLLYPINKSGFRDGFLNIHMFIRVSVDQMYGIEIDEFPALIAETALWLVDHQINQIVSREFGQNFLRIPLKAAATIRHGNALRIDWSKLGQKSLHIYADSLRVNLVKEVKEPSASYGRVTVTTPEFAVNPPGSDEGIGAQPSPVFNYILGNPPFIGGKYMSQEQVIDRDAVFHGVKNAGLLDFVSGWYRLAADYMKRHPGTRAAFVSTNSITQGEQVGVLWPDLFRRGIRIDFAHRTFKWVNEASGKAAVHCVIIGFGIGEPPFPRRIFDSKDLESVATPILAKNINPYLVDANDVVVTNRETPISPGTPESRLGNQPIDGGNYLFTSEEKRSFIALEPAASQFFRRWLGSVEFINGIERWCLWLGEASPAQLRSMPECLKRIDAVMKTRLASKREETRKLAKKPTRFAFETIPQGYSLVIPEVSSERREYIPIGFVGPEVLCSNLVKMVPNATRHHFGVITSQMHMAWMRTVCGRLKSDYRYSAGIVYNTFPWPIPSDKHQAAIEAKAQAVLDARAAHPSSSLADLYDPLTMPANLRTAHEALDRAVDAAYGYKGKADDASRCALLFKLYEKLVAEKDTAKLVKKVTKPKKSIQE